MAQRLQTVIVRKDRARTREQATAVARRFGKAWETSRETPNTWRFHQFPPEQCAGGEYTIEVTEGVLLFYCERRAGG